MATGQGAPSRLAGLDLLRFVAILMVLLRHAWTPPTPLPAVGRPLFFLLRQGGWAGVDLFFVLSGFLVSGLLFTEWQARGTISPLRFYARRGLKIYPAFYVLVAVTLVVQTVSGTVPWKQMLAEIFFIQSYVSGYWGHTWSLAIEEHFYLLLPLVLLAVLRLRRNSPDPFRSVVTIGLVVAVSGLVLRTANWAMRDGYSNQTHLYPTHFRIDSLFFGVVISYFYNFHTERFVALLRPWRRWLIAAGAAAFIPVFLLRIGTTPFIYTDGFTLLYLGGGALMVGVLLSNVGENRVIRPLAAMGAYSYSIYLWHVPVLEWVLPPLRRILGAPAGGATHTILFLGGSIAFGIGMARLVELPVLRLRDRFFPSRSKGAVVSLAEARPAVESSVPVTVPQSG